MINTMVGKYSQKSTPGLPLYEAVYVIAYFALSWSISALASPHIIHFVGQFSHFLKMHTFILCLVFRELFGKCWEAQKQHM